MRRLAIFPRRAGQRQSAEGFRPCDAEQVGSERYHRACELRHLQHFISLRSRDSVAKTRLGASIGSENHDGHSWPAH